MCWGSFIIKKFTNNLELYTFILQGNIYKYKKCDFSLQICLLLSDIEENSMKIIIDLKDISSVVSNDNSYFVSHICVVFCINVICIFRFCLHWSQQDSRDGEKQRSGKSIEILTTSSLL